MSNKNSTLFYHSWLDLFSELTLEEVGLLTVSILKYDTEGEIPELEDRTMRILFKELKSTIDRNKQAYEDRCEANRENANKRWSKDAIACNRMQSHAKNADKDKDIDNDIDIDKDDDRDRIDTNSQSAIISSWNSVPHTVNIRGLTDARIQTIEQCGVDDVLEAIGKVRDSEYLKQKGEIKFDNYINPQVLPKLLEGNYDAVYRSDKKTGTVKTQFQDFDQRTYDYEDLEERLVNK